ncbi:MAG: ABC transporter permease [bacterium]
MTLAQTITTSYNSLTKQKMRSFLTILAVAVGIGIVIIVLSSGAGMEKFISNQLDSFGTDLIEVEVKVPSTKQASVANAAGQAMGITITTLKSDDMDAVMKLPNIKNGYSMVMGQDLVNYQNESKKVMLMGVSPQASIVDKATKLAEGDFITEEDDKGLAQAAVLGFKVKEKLFGDDDAIGKYIKIKRKNFRVSGVLEKRGAMMGMDFDNLIYVPLKTLQKKILGIEHVSAIFMQVADMDLVNATKEDIEILLRERHNISDPTKDDFAVMSMLEAKEMMDKVFGGITLLLLALAAISLVVGGVGIMNIMYVSVVERTYEIGLRKALGAKNNDIMRQFLFEALLLTLTGGIVGILGGLSLTFLVSVIAKMKNFDLPFVISFNSLLVGVGFSGLMGLFFGIYPAKKAATLDPIVALTK